jgi:hypothetical protein
MAKQEKQPVSQKQSTQPVWDLSWKQGLSPIGTVEIDPEDAYYSSEASSDFIGNQMLEKQDKNVKQYVDLKRNKKT